MEKKDWKFDTREEYEKAALDYLDKHIERLEKDKISGYDKLDKDIKEYRNVRESNLEDEYKIKLGANIVKHDVKDWADFSLAFDSSLRDIMIRLLIGVHTNINYVCTLFLYSNENITEEFIDNLVYVTSPLFKFENWDDEHVEAVSYCAGTAQNPLQCKELLKLYDRRFLDNKKFPVRYDLRHSVLQFTDSFKRKYIKSLPPINNSDIYGKTIP